MELRVGVKVATQRRQGQRQQIALELESGRERRLRWRCWTSHELLCSVRCAMAAMRVGRLCAALLGLAFAGQWLHSPAVRVGRRVCSAARRGRGQPREELPCLSDALCVQGVLLLYRACRCGLVVQLLALVACRRGLRCGVPCCICSVIVAL
jgi:hypothetical protein